MTESDDALRVAREEIKRQAAEIERLQHWQRAVDDACAASWVAATDDACETVKALIARECQIALDPLVSSDAQALMDRGKEEAAAEIERLKTRLDTEPLAAPMASSIWRTEYTSGRRPSTMDCRSSSAGMKWSREMPASLNISVMPAITMSAT